MQTNEKFTSISSKDKGPQHISSKWTQVPMDVLFMILSLLNLADVAAFGAVCCRWTQAAKVFARHGKLAIRHIPWLVPSKRAIVQSVRLIEANRKRTDKFASLNRRCCGSFGEWLVICSAPKDVYIMHAYLRTRIKLPSQTMLSVGHNLPSDIRSPFFINKAIFSAPPTSNDCMVAVIFGHEGLAYCQCGDTKWNIIRDVQQLEMEYEDIAFHKGELFAITCTEQLFAYNIRKSPTAKRVIPLSYPATTNRNGLSSRYLIGYGTEQMILVRMFRPFSNPGKWLEDFWTVAFDVMQMQDSDSGRWIKLGGLQDQVIFVSRCHTAILPAAETCQQVSANSVYFTDDQTVGPEGPADIGMYSLTEGKRVPLQGEVKTMLFFYLLNHFTLM